MIVIEPYQGTPVAEHQVEIVERKGLGHPDYLCDSIMEAISIELSKEYMRELGPSCITISTKGCLQRAESRKDSEGAGSWHPWN